MTLLLRQFFHVLLALCARKRTYVGFGIVIFLDLFFLGLLQADNIRDAARRHFLKHPGYSDPANFSGLTVAHFILSTSLNWFAALFPALIAGDVVAKEVEDGTMQMTLVRPISRLRALALRWVACALYTCTFAVFLAAFALACGYVDQGFGNLLVVLPEQRGVFAYAAGPGLVRFVMAVPFQALCLLTIASAAFLLSCCEVRPPTATFSTLSILYIDRFLYDTEFFRVFRSWFLATRFDEWLRIYEPRIPWEQLGGSALILLIANLAFLVAGCCIFQQRDLKP